MFTRSEVIVLTNKQTNTHTHKQTPLKTSNALGYATTLGDYFSLLMASGINCYSYIVISLIRIGDITNSN